MAYGFSIYITTHTRALETFTKVDYSLIYKSTNKSINGQAVWNPQLAYAENSPAPSEKCLNMQMNAINAQTIKANTVIFHSR